MENIPSIHFKQNAPDSIYELQLRKCVAYKRILDFVSS